MKRVVAHSPAHRCASILLAMLLVMPSAIVPAGPAIAADSVIATVAVGQNPSAVAVNPLTHMAYVTNYYADTVSVIDGSGSDVVTATLSTRVNNNLAIPNAVVVDALASPPRAYVANFWANTISVIDEESLTVTATVASSGVHAGGPRALALNPSGATPKLYAADYGSGIVTVFDAETYSVIKRISVGLYPRALGIFVSGPRTRIFVANRGSNTVSIIDGDTDTVIKTVAVGAAPKSIAVDTSTGYAYVTNESGNSVSVIDDSDVVTATVPVGTRPIGIGIDTVRGRAFVANYGSGTVHVIRTSDFTREATLTVGTQPWAISVDEGDAKTYVTNYGSNSVSVIDATLGVASIPVGTKPYGIAVNEGHTPHKAYATNWGSNSVSVIDEPAASPAPVVGAAATPVAPVSGRTAVSDGGPIAVAIDPLPADATFDRTPVFSGTATSDRAPYDAAIVGVFYRLDGASRWSRADIVAGEGGSQVDWEIVIREPLDPATHTLEVMAMDQTGAAASVAEGATSVKTSTGGGDVAYAFTVLEAHPHVDSLSRYSGAPGTEVIFSGSGFGATQEDGWVTFAGTRGDVVSWSDTSVVARVPAGAVSGYAGVVAGGVASNGLYFIPYAAPAVTGMTPTSGPAGTVVTFTGTGFESEQGVGWVTFAGTPGEVVSWSDTRVEARVPAGAVAGYAGIVQHGLVSNGRYFVPYKAPVVTSLSVSRALVGASVTIRGTDFGSTPGKVAVGGVLFSADSWSDTQVTFTVPPTVRSGYAGVVANGLVSNGIYLAVAPRLTSLSTWWAAPGSQVTVRGSGFGATPGAYRVKVAGVEATQVVSWAEDAITFVVPTGATSGYVGVGTAEAISNGIYLVVQTPATLTRVSPNPVRAGEQIVLEGSGFGAVSPSSRVLIGAIYECTVVSWTDARIVATVPLTATSGYVGVYKQGVASNGIWLTVLPAAAPGVLPPRTAPPGSR